MEEHGDVDEREVGHFWNLLNYRRRDHSHKWKPIAVGMKTISTCMYDYEENHWYNESGKSSVLMVAKFIGIRFCTQ